MSTSNPAVAKRLFDEEGYPWEQRGQLALLSALNTPPPSLTTRQIRDLNEKGNLQIAKKAGFIGVHELHRAEQASPPQAWIDAARISPDMALAVASFYTTGAKFLQNRLEASGAIQARLRAAILLSVLVGLFGSIAAAVLLGGCRPRIGFALVPRCFRMFIILPIAFSADRRVVRVKLRFGLAVYTFSHGVPRPSVPVRRGGFAGGGHYV